MLSRARAFTLIEVVAVLVLAGLMATSATLMLRGAYRGSQMNDVISRIKAFDRSARRFAQLTGTPGVIRVDENNRVIRFTGIDDENTHLNPVVLPDTCRIKDVDVSLQASADGTGGITCSVYGQTPDYALTLSGPDDKLLVLVFAGMSGQVTELANEEEFDLDKLYLPRHDAH